MPPKLPNIAKKMLKKAKQQPKKDLEIEKAKVNRKAKSEVEHTGVTSSGFPKLDFDSDQEDDIMYEEEDYEEETEQAGNDDTDGEYFPKEFEMEIPLEELDDNFRSKLTFIGCISRFNKRHQGDHFSSVKYYRKNIDVSKIPCKIEEIKNISDSSYESIQEAIKNNLNNADISEGKRELLKTRMEKIGEAWERSQYFYNKYQQDNNYTYFFNFLDMCPATFTGDNITK